MAQGLSAHREEQKRQRDLHFGNSGTSKGRAWQSQYGSERDPADEDYPGVGLEAMFFDIPNM